jgi:hypothetical protein
LPKNKSVPLSAAGYSATPLAQKLGIKQGARVFAVGTPQNYRTLLAPLPDGVSFTSRLLPATDIVHLFTRKRAELEKSLGAWYGKLKPDAAVWVSWPKKSSGVATDITEDVVREVALPIGLVDIKVCAVDATWSGLKLVIRKENRTDRS